MSKRNRRKRYTTAPAVAAQKDFGLLMGADNGLFGYGGVSGRNTNLTRTEWGAATAFQIMPEVNRAMNLRADALGSLPWQILKLDTNGKEIILATNEDAVPRHPLAKAFSDTYKYSNRSLLSLMCYSNDLSGEVFIQKTWTQEDGRSLKWLNPLSTQPIIVNGGIQYYQYNQLYGGISETLKPKDVAYYHNWNPYNDFRGQGLTQVVMQKINMARNLDDFIEDFFGNNARPSVIVSPTGDEPFTSDQKSKLQQQMDVFLKGRGNQWATYVSPINAKYDPLDQPKIGEHYTIAPELSQYIYTVYGVPKALAGDDSGTQYKTGDDVKVAFFQITIIPLASHLERYVNSSIMPYLDDSGVFFRFDTSEFDLVSDDDKMRMDIASTAYSGGLWTRNKSLEYTKVDKLGSIDFLLIEGIPIPLEEVGQYWKYKLITQPDSQQAAPVGNALGVETVEPKPLPAPTANPVVGGAAIGATPTQPSGKAVITDNNQSYCALGRFDSVLDIVKVQDMLNGMLTSYVDYDNVEFIDPTDFHVTVVYANSGNLAQAQESLPLNPGAISVMVDGVGCFDTPDGYVIHLTLRKEGALPAVQAALSMAMSANGFDVSNFSKPDAYIPHITLAYAPFSIIPFNVTPFSLVMNKIELCDSTHKPIIEQQLKMIVGKATQTTAEDELRAWERKATRAWKALFEPVHLRGDLGDFIANSILASNGDAAALKAVFVTARERLTTKAIQATRLDFEHEFEDLLHRARNERIDRRTFGSTLRFFLNKFGKLAYADGLIDGGVDEPPDTEDLSTIAMMLADQSAYVSNFGETIFYGDGISDAEAVLKASQWWGGSIQPFYDAGGISANGNAMKEFAGESGVDSCPECIALVGQRHRFKDFARKGYMPPYGENLTCNGGKHCKHKLVTVYGKARGSWV